MRTRICMANCAAGPRRPSSISLSRGERVSILLFRVGRGAPPPSPRSRVRARSRRGRCARAYLEQNVAALLTIIRRMRQILAALILLLLIALSSAQAPAASVTILRPARVFDGDAAHDGWSVRVRGDRIEAVGPDAAAGAAGARVIDLSGTTLTPGLVEGHSHLLLHAYSETSWTDQVSREGLALRVARAVNHLHATLMAGFTTVRDLGTEGAQYADVELKQAVNQGDRKSVV